MFNLENSYVRLWVPNIPLNDLQVSFPREGTISDTG